MIPDRSNRPAASGLVLALAVLGGLAGLAGALPSASFGSLGQPQTDQATALPPPSASPSKATACQVVAGPYSVTADGGILGISARLQNAGAAPVTLEAVEAGWQGAALLTSIVFEGGTEIPVKSAVSPALVPLVAASPVVLAPGASLSLRLVFSRPDPEAAFEPGPIAVHVHEGCVVALRPVADTEGPCPLYVGRPAPDAAVAEQVVVSLKNSADTSIDLAMLDLTWPAEANGALVALRLGGQPEQKLESPAVRSPAVLDLARTLVDGVALAPGSETTLGLIFERPAAQAGYAVSLSTRQGCAASATDWLANPYCALDLGEFESGEQAAHLLLTNRSGISQTLTILDLFWTPAINGALVQVLADGKPVWSAGSSVSPVSIRAFDRAVVVGPRSTIDLQLRFEPAAGPPNDGGEIGGDLTVLAGFQSGCEVAFSTLRGDAGACRVWAVDQLAPRGDGAPNEVSAGVINTGSTSLLRTVAVSWPERNGNLTGLYLGSTSLLDRPQPPGPRPFELRLDAASMVPLPRGTTQLLRLTFARAPADGGYSALLGVAQMSGEPCAEVKVSSPPITPECDKLSFTDKLDIRGRNAFLTLRNDSPDPLRISDVSLDWPELQGLTLFRLVTLAMINDVRGEWTIWSGSSQAQPPITVRPDPAAMPAVIQPGTSVILRLTFDPAPPNDPPESLQFRAGLRVTVGFAEGCRTAYPLSGARVSSQSIEFSGVIRDFPRRDGEETLFGCCWQIYADRDQKLRDVEVDADTRFRPISFRPKRGDIVQVDALVSPEGRLYARRIIFRVQRPEELIVGAIEKMAPEAVTPPAVPAQISVDGTLVVINDRTDIPDVSAFRIGARVAVRGTRNDNEQIDALRVEGLDPPTGQLVAIRGAVREVTDSGEPGIQSTWVVDHYLVQVPEGAPIQGLPPSGRPGLGWEARIEGTQSGDVVRAVSGQLFPAPQLREIDGTLAALPLGGMRGDWVIRTAEGEAAFTVESSAVVNTRAAPVAIDLRVHAVVRDNGSDTPVAVSVRMDWP